MSVPAVDKTTEQKNATEQLLETNKTLTKAEYMKGRKEQTDADIRKHLTKLFDDCYIDKRNEKGEVIGRDSLIDRFIHEAERARGNEATSINSGWDSCMRSMVGLLKTFSEALSAEVSYGLSSLALPLIVGPLLNAGESVVYPLFNSKKNEVFPELHYKLSVDEGGKLTTSLTTPEGLSQFDRHELWSGFFKLSVMRFLEQKGYVEDNGVLRENSNGGTVLTQALLDSNDFQNEFNQFLSIPQIRQAQDQEPAPSPSSR